MDTERRPFVMHFGLMTETGFLVPGGITVAINDSKKVGWAICSPFDKFTRKKGLEKAFERLEKQPYTAEDFNPQWDYETKTEYVSLLASFLVRDMGGENWRRDVQVVPRKQKFFKFVEPDEVLRMLQGESPEPEEDKGVLRKFLSNMFGRG